ncbi:ATP-grasp domain protein [Methylophaga frappieri]|uniref:ATP-grasp domain protein n=2 Tax=Methylophaga frappieri (strain ATCC BAA-2434 / DSM 25690 / JAM7) TaxID=754477 RepID=I1YK91_METFJ|nr:ATP-grasp domain protein [Methylophaga frappieri]
MSFNEQICRNTSQHDFQLLAITNQLDLDTAQQRLLTDYCQQLTEALSLRGFCSLDFIIDKQGQIHILEINPRPSASMQCLPITWPLIQWHLDACQGQLPSLPALPVCPPQLLYYCFTARPIRIPDQFNWPANCHDLPPVGQRIPENHILCSFLYPVKTSLAALLPYCHRLATELQIQCLNY